MTDVEWRDSAAKMLADSVEEGRNINGLRRRIEKLEIADLTRRIERLEKLQNTKPGNGMPGTDGQGYHPSSDGG
jgi:uncharacterized coiled-coil DUF342 family protein